MLRIFRRLDNDFERLNVSDLLVEELLRLGRKEKIKKEAFAYTECDTVENVFTTDVFQALFELSSDNKEEKKTKAPTTVPTIEIEEDVDFEVMADAA